MVNKVLFALFVVFAASRLLAVNFIPPIVYTIVTFGVPAAYFAYKKDYFLFSFNKEDTLPSIGLNLLFSLVFVFVLLIFGFFTNNNNWVLLFSVTPAEAALFAITSFLQEMLFRYFVQGTMVKITGNKLVSIAATSLVSGLVLLPSLYEAVVYLLMGLFLGYIFEKTKDIYGATLADFIITSFARVTA